MPPTDPVAQAKGMKTAAVSLVLAGLVVGIGLPVVLTVSDVQVLMMSWGFDAFWLLSLAIMVVDFGMARYFWRRAIVLERSPRGG
jgi:hypothetical protein